MCRKPAYESVVVTPAMQADYMSRVYPMVQRAAWTAFRGLVREHEEDRAEVTAISWRMYLERVARGESVPAAEPIAHYSVLRVRSRCSLVHSNPRKGKEVELVAMPDEWLGLVTDDRVAPPPRKRWDAASM